MNIIPFEFDTELAIVDDLQLTARQNSHIKNKHNIESYSKFISSSFQLITQSDRIIYTADIGSKNDLFLFDQPSPRIFISETSHIELNWVLEIFTNINPGKIILTHISDEDEYKIQKWLECIPEELRAKINMAEDGHIVTLNN